MTRKWKKLHDDPLVYKLVGKKIFAEVGQNPSTGKYDAWVQKEDKIIRWLVMDTTRPKAVSILNKLMSGR